MRHLPHALTGSVLKEQPENIHGPAGDAKLHDAGWLKLHWQ
jgi:hypothetical protein